MENIRKFLDYLYNSNYGMLYFYIITGSIALILIILIIINVKKSKKQEINIDNNIGIETEKIEEHVTIDNDTVKEKEEYNVFDDKIVNEQKVEDVMESTNNNDDVSKVEDTKLVDNIEVNDANIVSENNKEVIINEVDELDRLYNNYEKNDEKIDNEDEIELPKVKENSDLSSESFMERLNALKNK